MTRVLRMLAPIGAALIGLLAWLGARDRRTAAKAVYAERGEAARETVKRVEAGQVASAKARASDQTPEESVRVQDDAWGQQ